MQNTFPETARRHPPPWLEWLIVLTCGLALGGVAVQMSEQHRSTSMEAHS